MIDPKLCEQLRVRRAGGVSIHALAREFGLSRGAVRRCLRGGARRAPGISAARPSKLDPYRAKIQQLVIGQGLSAVRVLEELRALGYAGGHSILKEYVHTIRPRSRTLPTVRLETPPGELAQMDWSPYSLLLGREERVVQAFSLVLAYSRYLFMRFALQTDLATLERLHSEAFQHLGGVVSRISYDNMTTVGRHRGPGEIWLNPQFEQFARSYGFAIEILPPGRPRLHGKVERPFAYLEGNFLAGRSFDSLDHLNAKLARWLEQANQRLHGTTRERPIDRLALERSYLKGLPGQPPELARLLERKVQSDFSVVVSTNRYSVAPRYVGRWATVKLYHQHIEVVIDSETVARHPLLAASYGRSLLPEHQAAFQHHSPQRELLKVAFFRLGKAAESYYDGLIRARGQGAGYHLAKILRLAARYGAQATSGALAHAARYGAYSAEAIARVLQGRALRLPKQAPHPLPLLVPGGVKAWLEGEDVEAKDLSEYDQLIEPDASRAGDPEPEER